MMDLRKQGYLNKEIIMGIRPEDFHDFHKTSTVDSFIDAKIEVIELLGAENILHSQIAGQPFTARIDTQSVVQQGQMFKLALDMNKVHFFDYETKNRITLDE